MDVSNSKDVEWDDKKVKRMRFIYCALEKGWTVRKSSNGENTFEFSKSHTDSVRDMMVERGVLLLGHNAKKIIKITSEPISKNKCS